STPCEGEHGEAESESRDRGARERPQQRGERDGGEGGEQADPATKRPDGRRDEQCDDEHVARRERAQEDRDEPAQEVALGARVVDEVLRQATRAVVVVAELLVEVVRDAGGPPPADRDRGDLDEAERGDRGGGGGQCP